MKTVEATIPDQLDRAIDALVERGWFENRNQVLEEALRRFLQAHQPELIDKLIREDVEWGLHGQS